MSQTALDEQFDRNYERFDNTLSRKNNQVIRALDKARLTLSDVLNDYEDDQGTIPREQLSAVLSEMPEVEREMYRSMRDELRAVARNSAQYTSVSTMSAFIAAIGAPALVEFAGLSSAAIAAEEVTAEMLFLGLVGTGILDFITSIADSVFNRKGDDGMTLDDRLSDFAEALRKEISTTLRESIQAGEGTGEILRKVNRNLRKQDWRVKTIVETESMYAMRNSLARIAERTSAVEALRIVDYPHGDPAEHRRHQCYIYAHRNEHGLGTGVYPVGTRKIRNPHPRCRSSLFFVLTEELR